MFGIDVSHNNGVINWAKVATNIPKVDFAFIKASEGATLQDSQFLNNVKGCAANNIKWGAYHFATWNSEDEKADAEKEADFFISVVKKAKLNPSMPLVLDVESEKIIPYTKIEMVEYISAFQHKITQAGFEMAIYSSPGFLNTYLPADHPFSSLKLWAADYTPPINKVAGWSSIFLHQFTDKGHVAGINGFCDLNKSI